MNRLFSYTWVGWLNILLLQWLFVRLYYVIDSNDQMKSYGILLPIIPFTGWYTNYLPSKHYHFNFTR